MFTRDETFEIAVGGHCIAATLIVPDARMPGVLFLHGWGSSQANLAARAREIAAIGCACLTIDMRGHAKTATQQATVTREDNLTDALAAYDRLVREAAVDDDQVAVIGSSYGGYLATILTSLRPVRWLALRVPALYKDSDWDLPKGQLRKLQELESYRLQPVRPEESVALKACAGFTGDVLLVESEHDSTVPHQVIINYRDACTSAHSLSYRVIRGADHSLSDPRWQQAYTTLLVNWFSEMLGGARGHWEAGSSDSRTPALAGRAQNRA